MSTPVLAYSAVRVLDAEGHLLRVISTEELQQRRDPFAGHHAPPVERATERAYYPSVAAVRRQKASASLTKRNRARTRGGVVAA